MHRLSHDYDPPEEHRRPHWHQLEVFKLEPLLAERDSVVLPSCRETLAQLEQLPRTPDGYGLIHADPEPWNMLLEAGVLSFIDFEECCYHWFGFDLAVSIMYATLAAEPAKPEAYAAAAWQQLLNGYGDENELSAYWLGQTPLFLKLRLLQDHAFHLGLWGNEPREPSKRKIVERQRRLILQDRPFPDIAFG
jgi:Ser/Thr protein kinase RdoA (MazF antagonist)